MISATVGLTSKSSLTSNGLHGSKTMGLKLTILRGRMKDFQSIETFSSTFTQTFLCTQRISRDRLATHRSPH